MCDSGDGACRSLSVVDVAAAAVTSLAFKTLLVCRTGRRSLAKDAVLYYLPHYFFFSFHGRVPEPHLKTFVNKLPSNFSCYVFIIISNEHFFQHSLLIGTFHILSTPRSLIPSKA